ncbi:MAG: glycoside hydrolase family 99-like domain-containing protein, partial [Myxococcota bacterium]|nr:glycoside hydrolase family 99-like domain-containing protein [Myxococcota bacterium]
MIRKFAKRVYHAYKRLTLASARRREARAAHAIRQSTLFDESFYRDRYPDALTSDLDPISHYCRWGDAAGYAPHPIFDPLHYSKQFPAIPRSGGRRLLHYLQNGTTPGISPHPLFDSEFYLEQCAPLLLPGDVPLSHYLREGEALGYWPDPLFDPQYYERENPELTSLPCKLSHYISHGTAENRAPIWLFDPAWYQSQYSNIGPTNSSPLIHYLERGDQAGLSPHPFFDPDHYSLQYPTLPRNGGARLHHFLTRGHIEPSSPHPLFDSEWYRKTYSHIVDEGTNPLRHFLQTGQQLGLAPHADFTPPSVQTTASGQNTAPHHSGMTQGFHNEPIRLRPEPNESQNAGSPSHLSHSQAEPRPKLIAFYLPQYHPIKENDEWWGKGFTEWTNVSRSTPLYPGHSQPQLPADLGFYDLRLPEVRASQAEMAKAYGVDGFCYYYYWFEGRKLLERPLEEVLETGQPNFPFCICWANENWTRRWDGLEDQVLLRQSHSLQSDYQFIQEVLPILKDPRYIRVEGAPMLLVYRPDKIRDPEQTTAMWRDAARKAGLPGLHLAMVQYKTHEPQEFYFDSAVEFPPHHFPALPSPETKNIQSPDFTGAVLDYPTGVEELLRKPDVSYLRYRGVMPA